MQPLEKSLRNQLEHIIKDARDTAEAAARAVLAQLGVGEAAVFAHLSEAERQLRRKLRVHGRQLGDLRDVANETQALDRLTEEVAYEHWHRMLFARFLAENNLLIYPDPDDPVAVTLEECEDLAADEGAADGWELAARFAARMLPQIFRPDSPVFQLILPPEHQQKLERLAAALPPEVFTASDSLGWVYQFWQARRKDEINAAEVKIGARELPAVTQLFTEPYMVSFLLDNSLGAWWVKQGLGIRGQGLVGGSGDLEKFEPARNILQSAATEDELREFFSRSGVPLAFLRFVKTDHCTLMVDGTALFAGSHWMPAGGWFTGWPDNLAELKTLDPCCGSGHFLVAALLMLVPMRMELEELSARAAVDAVLRENIHGLELDQRCVELAAFALALTAWRYPDAGGYRILPELNLACSGLAISAKKEEWLALAGSDINLRYALGELYKQFKDAPVLGSLINPEASLGKGSLFELKWDEVGPLLVKALAGEKDDEKTEMGVVASGIAKASMLMVRGYDLLITNVPYLVRGKHSVELKKHLESHFNDGKHDLAYSFLIRCLQYLKKSGNASVVMPENWLYINPCQKFRNNIIDNFELDSISRLGPGAFQTISGEVVKGLLVSIMNNRPSPRHHFFGLDAWAAQGPENKSLSLIINELQLAIQADQKKNPDSRISLAEIDGGALLSKVAEGLHGQGTFDKHCYVFQFWEVQHFYEIWEPQQSTPNRRVRSDYGASQIFRWEEGKGLLYNFIQQKKEAGYTSGKWKAGVNIWGSSGVAVSGIGYLYIRPYLGKAFDENVAVIHPCNHENLPAISLFVESDDFQRQLKQIDSNLKASCNTLVKVPFDLENWRSIAKDNYLSGLQKPSSGDPSQWIFHGHPVKSEEPLQIAVARLLGYRWPAELDAKMELAAEQREWVNRCEALLPFVDDDGIVCIPPVRGEAAASDRLLNLLAAAYGDSWSIDTLAELLKNSGHAGKTLETWLREKFFTQHCKLFRHRPFIWQIWDGLPDGFAALVNYHKLDHRLLETLVYTYLGDWISRQKQEIKSAVDGAMEKLAAAENLKEKLELILAGEAPFDIFIRWKPVEQQPIGWNPDLNDGIRLNIRPFMTVPEVKKRGAGILRDKPNIKWNKDRGKDVESAPWFHLGPTYGGKEGDRINDHHLTLAEKRAAREASK